MKSFTLAIVADRYWPSRGGVEQAMVSLAAALPADWRVTVVAHSPPAENTFLYGSFTSHRSMPERDPSGKTIESLTAGRSGRLLLLPLLVWNIPLLRKLFPQLLYDALYFWYRLAFYRRLERLLDDVDSVHCCSTGYLARCISEICLKKGLRFFHQPFVHFDRWGDTPALLRAYAAADAVICPTVKFRDRLLGRFERYGAAAVDMPVIPPVMNETGYPKLRMPPVPGRFILFLGRREEHKGLTTLLVAFTGLEGIASLVVAGPGEQVHTRNTSVFDLGEVDDHMKDWLFSSCDVFCVPTRDESFGIVFAEAMRYGKPVVACDIAPVNEIVVHDRTGILVPVDATEAVHNALEMVLEDNALRKRLGAAGRQRYEELFSREVVAGKIVRLHRR
ncbi:MAG: glycosyltransferase family 4 protein [Chitinispirillaceae bacterium]|nr:glycosyltransferase family 4 protein [Chitinispirillaceae bacterium]